jgi:glycosyltransferase involved in cell wall biosynthesis
VIFNGVNTETFTRNERAGHAIRESLKIPEGARVVGIVTVFRFQKRLKEWLEIFSSVSKKHSTLYGIIVGDGPLRGEVEQQIKKLGLQDRIFMPGLQSDIRPWYSAMDIFMMSSVFEGMPLALLEAMSMECVVVSTNAGGIKEVARHEVDGLIEPVDDWKKLEGHLERLISDELYRQRLGKAARLRVEKSFSLKKMVDELEGLYDSFSSVTSSRSG